MKVERFMVGPLMTNCYLVTCETGGASVLVDPGGVSIELENALGKTNLSAIVLTHGHFDHIAGLNTLLRNTDVPVLIHPSDTPMLSDPYLNGSFMGETEIILDIAAGTLAHGDSVTCGDSALVVVHTPGHSEGSISLFFENEFVISGDTLFRLSVGRWDLPGGNYSRLMESITTVYLQLPDSMALYPGHGEPSMIGYEKQFNQFLENVNHA